MSLYNTIFGVNPMAGLLLQVLGVKPRDIPRPRDVWLDVTAPEKPLIIIYTRTGGGNRSRYEENNEEYPEGPTNSKLRQIKGFIKDEDDDFDSTYALFYYSLPEKSLAQVLLEIHRDLEIDPRLPSDRFRQLTKDLEEGKDTPDTQQALEAGKQIIGSIADLLRK